MLRRTVFIAGVILVFASIAATASAQPRGGMFGGPFGGGSSAMILGMPEVQTELNLNDDQKTQITTLISETREKMRASIGQINFQEMQDLSQEERQKRFDEIRKKAEEASKGVDEKVNKLLDAKQVERLKQLQLQREGASALNRPEVIQKLALTDDQQAKIKKIQADGMAAARPNFDPNQTPEERQANMKKIRDQIEKVQKDCLAVLNDDQMLDWTNMCGKTFKFPAFGRGNRPAPQQ
ncbi:MAG: hypothetical protein ACLP9L_22130 [Thermoguttaceae bacterium]